MILKLFRSTVFLEKLVRYKNMKLITTLSGAKKQINKAEFASYNIINPNLIVAELKPTIIKLCKPIYAGMVRYFC